MKANAFMDWFVVVVGMGKLETKGEFASLWTDLWEDGSDGRGRSGSGLTPGEAPSPSFVKIRNCAKCSGCACSPWPWQLHSQEIPLLQGGKAAAGVREGTWLPLLCHRAAAAPAGQARGKH